jgi:hypothetical protein
MGNNSILQLPSKFWSSELKKFIFSLTRRDKIQ